MAQRDEKYLLQKIQEDFKSPFGDVLGIDVVKASHGSVVLEIKGEKVHTNSLQIIHGGVTASLCDVAMGAAIGTLGLVPITVEMKVNYLSPGQTNDVIVAKGNVVKAGENLVISEGEVYQKGKLLAKSLGTYSTKKPEEVNISKLSK